LPYGFAGSGKISGLTGLTKQGSGTLVVANSGVNDFGGDITIGAGTLQVGSGGTAGNLGAGAINNSANLVVNRSDALTLNNAISGPSASTLTKNGTGTLTLGGNNTFTGAVSVAEGTLRVANASALGRTNGSTMIAGGATLDFNAINVGLEPVIVSGAGVNNNGALFNSGAQVLPAVARVTLTGNTTFGGTGRWDLRSATTGDPSQSSLVTGGQPYSLIKTGANQVSIVGTTVDPALGDVDVQQGTFSLEVATTGIGNPANNLIVRSGATLQLFQLTNRLNKVITLNGNGTANTILNANGVGTIIGPTTLNGDCIVNVATAGTTPSLTLSNTIGGSGSLIKSGTGPLILAGGPDTYTGNTTVSNGTLLINCVVNGGGTLTVVSNATVGGTGTHTGPVAVGGVVAPGTSAGT
jgi:autotransporter-associated beta strand protein